MNDEEWASAVPDPTELTEIADSAAATVQRIGNYRILQKLGEGGMGVVYEAEQERPVRRRVALKVIKLGMDTEQVVVRFESERQALALMNHPNIARVFDAGATEHGRPYFAMECVKGIPITDYCDRNRMKIEARLDLFIQVCEGVQHAHQKGIIHRDIKPSNVLVHDEDGRHVPKIIDFGIAKATAKRLTDKTFFTELGQLIGTPEYMSPEQAEMSGLDIDTRTDVYLLGVLLYELLTGELPFGTRELSKVGFNEYRRLVLEEQPPKPSTRLTTHKGDSAPQRAESLGAARLLRGDLDWITMKALEKDRTRRYASASELANEIRRYLKSEPVLAGPPSNLYRLRKFAVRHRTGVIFSGVLLVLLTGSAALTAVQYRQNSRSRDEAERQRKLAVESSKLAEESSKEALVVSDFLLDLFRVSDPSEARGNTITAREILDRSARKIDEDEDLRDKPRIRAQLMQTMGEVYSSLGLVGEAVQLLDKAYGIRVDTLDDEDLLVAESAHDLAGVLVRSGQSARARQMYQRALDIRRNKLGKDDPLVASTLNDMACFLSTEGQYEEALEKFEQAFDYWESTGAAGDPRALASLSNRALMFQRAGQYDAAREVLERVLDVQQKTSGPLHASIAFTLHNLGDLLEAQGDYPKAADFYQRALGMYETLHQGRDHEKVAIGLTSLAIVSYRMGEAAKGAALYRRVVEMTGRLAPENQAFDLPYRQACYAAVVGDRAGAVRLLRHAVDRGFRDIEMLRNKQSPFAALADDPAFRSFLADLEARIRPR